MYKLGKTTQTITQGDQGNVLLDGGQSIAAICRFEKLPTNTPVVTWFGGSVWEIVAAGISPRKKHTETY